MSGAALRVSAVLPTRHAVMQRTQDALRCATVNAIKPLRIMREAPYACAAEFALRQTVDARQMRYASCRVCQDCPLIRYRAFLPECTTILRYAHIAQVRDA